MHYRGVTARTKVASLPPHLGDLVGAMSSVNHKGLHQGCYLLGDNTWEYGGGDKASLFFVFLSCANAFLIRRREPVWPSGKALGW